jgi:hypothetical protein
VSNTDHDRKRAAARRLLQFALTCRRYIGIFIVVLVALGIGYAILEASHDGLGDPGSVLSTLLWITLIIVAVLYFEDVLIEKFKAVGEIPTPWGAIKTDTARIPVPPRDQAVTLENVALLHTSFSRKDETDIRDDGMAYYQIEVILLAPDEVLNRVEQVTYYLDKVYPDPVRTVKDRTSRFKLKELANGTSIVRADVKLREQDNPIQLNRFIDLRRDGPRI